MMKASEHTEIDTHDSISGHLEHSRHLSLCLAQLRVYVVRPLFSSFIARLHECENVAPRRWICDIEERNLMVRYTFTCATIPYFDICCNNMELKCTLRNACECAKSLWAEHVQYTNKRAQMHTCADCLSHGLLCFFF